MFAVLILPSFRLSAALRWRAELWDAPVALVEKAGAKDLVVACTPAASAAGVRSGQPTPQALARCAQLLILPPAPAQERALDAALLEVAFSFSPEVEQTAPGICTVDLRRAGIRDYDAWAKTAADRAQQCAQNAQLGIAENPDLAFLAAKNARQILVVKSARDFLTSLAVQELDPPPQLLGILHDWGIHTLGQLTALPRGELADRLGPDSARLWERAAGRTERLLRLSRVPETFAESAEFEYEVESTEPLLFLLRRFLDSLTARLAGLHRVTERMTLELALEGSQRYERDFQVPSPTADPSVLFRILETHLETLRLEQRPVGLRLVLASALPSHDRFQLFENTLRDPNRFGETIARISALIGGGSVGVPVLEDTHRPDRWRLAEPRFHESTRTTAPALQMDGIPLRRFRPGFSANVQIVDHAPAFIVSEKALGAVIKAGGPFQLDGGWWDARDTWSTEEWDVELADGSLWRISRTATAWQLEGSYEESTQPVAKSNIVPFRAV